MDKAQYELDSALNPQKIKQVSYINILNIHKWHLCIVVPIHPPPVIFGVLKKKQWVFCYGPPPHGGKTQPTLLRLPGCKSKTLFLAKIWGPNNDHVWTGNKKCMNSFFGIMWNFKIHTCGIVLGRNILLPKTCAFSHLNRMFPVQFELRRELSPKFTQVDSDT